MHACALGDLVAPNPDHARRGLLLCLQEGRLLLQQRILVVHKQAAAIHGEGGGVHALTAWRHAA